MSKTDKELTAEIIIAYINANPTQASYVGGNSHSKVEKFVNIDGLCNGIKAIHSTLADLEKPSVE